MSRYVETLAELPTYGVLDPQGFHKCVGGRVDAESLAAVGHAAGVSTRVVTWIPADVWDLLVAFVHETDRVVFGSDHGDPRLWDAIEALEHKVESL